jgi:exo-beta-1,3-glucanase (GH17 family)
MMRPHFGSERELYAVVYSPMAKDNHPKIYPNPATDLVHLGGRYTSVKLYNLSGLEVLSAADTDEINVRGIVPGIYYLKRANDDYEQIISKLVILNN